MNRPAAATAAARASQQRRRSPARPQRGEQPREPKQRQNPTSEFYAPRQRAHAHTGELGRSHTGEVSRVRRPEAKPTRDVRPSLYNQAAADAMAGRRPPQAARIVPSVVTPPIHTGEYRPASQTTSDGIPLLQVSSAETGRRSAARKPKLSTSTFTQQRRASAAARAANTRRPATAMAATTTTGGATTRGAKTRGATARGAMAHGATIAPRLPREHSRQASKPIARPHRPVFARPQLSLKSLKPGPMLIDRIIRGRAWIPILAALLLTVVGMRVWALRLGMRHSQETELAAQLASSNGVLKVQESQLSNPARIMKLAEGYGMYMPSTGAVKFVPSGSAAETQKAIKSITQPSSSYTSGTATDSASNSTDGTGGSSSSSTSNANSSGSESSSSSASSSNSSGGSGLAVGSGSSSSNSTASGSNSSGTSSAGSSGSGTGGAALNIAHTGN